MSWWQNFRGDFFSDVGVLLPTMRVTADDLIPASSFRVSSGGVEMMSGQVLPDALLVEISSSQAAMLGLEVLQEEEHPITGHRIFWALHTPALRRMLESASIRGLDFFEYVGLRIGNFCMRHPEEFLSVTDVHSLLRQVEKRHPGLIAEGFGKDFVSVPRLTEILQELVRQGVSIRDFRGVIESVSAFCSSRGVTLDNEHSLEVSDVVGSIRSFRRRQILRRYMGSARSLRVVSLSTEVESAFAEAEFENRALPVALEADVYEALVSGLQMVLKPALELGIVPVAVVCASELRDKVISLARACGRSVFVVSFEELDPAIPVEQVGTWALAYR
jgi:type III secretory pathway component EscV